MLRDVEHAPDLTCAARRAAPARSSWPVTARDSSWSTDSSSTRRRFSSNRRAFSIATPAWLAMASMSASSLGENSRDRVHHTTAKPPIIRSLATTGTHRWLLCGACSRRIAAAADRSRRRSTTTARRVRGRLRVDRVLQDRQPQPAQRLQLRRRHVVAGQRRAATGRSRRPATGRRCRRSNVFATWRRKCRTRPCRSSVEETRPAHREQRLGLGQLALRLAGQLGVLHREPDLRGDALDQPDLGGREQPPGAPPHEEQAADRLAVGHRGRDQHRVGRQRRRPSRDRSARRPSRRCSTPPAPRARTAAAPATAPGPAAAG